MNFGCVVGRPWAGAVAAPPATSASTVRPRYLLRMRAPPPGGDHAAFSPRAPGPGPEYDGPVGRRRRVAGGVVRGLYRSSLPGVFSVKRKRRASRHPARIMGRAVVPERREVVRVGGEEPRLGPAGAEIRSRGALPV